MKRARGRGLLFLGILALALGFAASVLLQHALKHSDCRDLGSVAGFPDNSVSFARCARVYVVHGLGDDFAIYLAETPHLPYEPLRYDPIRHRFFGLHGETFDVRGLPLRGPAQGALFRCPARIEDGDLVMEAESPAFAAIRVACLG